MVAKFIPEAVIFHPVFFYFRDINLTGMEQYFVLVDIAMNIFAVSAISF